MISFNTCTTTTELIAGPITAIVNFDARVFGHLRDVGIRGVQAVRVVQLFPYALVSRAAGMEASRAAKNSPADRPAARLSMTSCRNFSHRLWVTTE